MFFPSGIQSQAQINTFQILLFHSEAAVRGRERGLEDVPKNISSLGFFTDFFFLLSRERIRGKTDGNILTAAKKKPGSLQHVSHLQLIYLRRFLLFQTIHHRGG